MNDATRRMGSWTTPAQQNCPNCRQGRMMQPQNMATPQMPFLSRGVQEMVANGPAAQQEAAQFPPQESTSNYADLGMAPVGFNQNEDTGLATAQNAMLDSSLGTQNQGNLVQYRQQGREQLSGLVGSMPSPTELPGLTAINLQNQTTAFGSQNLQYLNGFLVTQIGRTVTVTFLIGSNSMDVRSGTLVGVGANYILINEFETNDIVACDFYSIKFVKIYY